MIGAATIGTFLLPSTGTAIGRTAAEKPAAAGALAEKIRRLITKPDRTRKGNGFFLTWMEEDETDETGCAVMVWQPETPKEIAEATRFYEAARNYDRGPDAVDAREGVAGKVKRSAKRLLATQRSPAERALLNGIIERPEEDAPWLAYADFLDQRRDPLGQFIRVNHELDQLGAEDPRRPPLNDRWRELIDKHAEGWLSGLTELGLGPGPTDCAEWWLDKGLVTKIEIEKPGILPKRAAQLFDAAPALVDLSIVSEEINLKALARVPQLVQLRSLEISIGDFSDADFSAIVNSPNLARLKTLDVSFKNLTPPSIRSLIDSPLLKHLTTLRLATCDCGDEPIHLLSQSPGCRGLRALDLGNCELTAAACESIAASPHLKGLRNLTIGANPIGHRGLAALSRAAFMPGLESLDLYECDLGDGGGAVLAASTSRSLERLNLANNHLTDDDVEALVSTDFLSSVKVLDLSWNAVGEAGARSLATCGRLHRLTILKCGHNDLGDAGAAALADWSGQTPLKTLELQDTGIGHEGAAALARSPLLAHLEVLYLDGNSIGVAGAEALADSPYLKNLKKLSITGKRLGKAGAQALAARFGDAVLRL